MAAVFNLETLVLINLIIMIGCLIQGTIGYGLGIFSAPLLFMINASLVPAPLILISTLVTIILIIRDKADLEFHQVSWAMAGSAFGITLAGAVISLATTKQFQILFGVMILCGVGISLIGIKPKVNKVSNSIAGFTSGLMGTITAVGGPPMALLYQHGELKNIKANLTAFFLFVNIAALTTFYAVDKIDVNAVKITVLSLPSIALGLYLSSYLSRLLAQHSIKWYILSFSSLTAAITLFKGLS